MRPITIDCPLCGATHEFYLRDEDDHHLRQCPSCEVWFVLIEGAEDDEAVEIEALGNPATCPIEECEAVLEGEELPAHVIEAHGASLESA